ncbi:Fic family protein [Candidatus Gracilibacteria bacterium]|nr:Fic family protein [Candidatus Gracilibacteria bacterium]
MFIERKDSGLFLAKKVGKKKFLVQGDVSRKVSKENITQITQKECDILSNSLEYKNFSKNIHHPHLLENILLKSKYLGNILEMIESFDENQIDHTLIKEGKYLQKWMKYVFPKKFIYNSNNIEGSKIPEDEVEKIIKHKKYSHKIINEIQEVENSIEVWGFLINDFIFNEANIKKLYHKLTKNLVQENGEKYPRGFKKISNVVNNDITTPPEKVSEEICRLIEWYRGSRKEVFSLQLAFDFHLTYEQIHPFENGNGRTGRLLMNKILIQNGMLPMVVFTQNKQSYFNAIASCNTGNKKKYYTFMLEQYEKTLESIHEVMLRG